jgi:hypothetical protein
VIATKSLYSLIHALCYKHDRGKEMADMVQNLFKKFNLQLPAPSISNQGFYIAITSQVAITVTAFLGQILMVYS